MFPTIVLNSTLTVPDPLNQSPTFYITLCLFTDVFYFLSPVPPVFRYKILPMDINVGNSAKFECETEDAPNVTFKWFKSGTEIKQSEKYRILSRHHSSSLEILNPTKADSSEYTCKASNQHGSDSCSTSLTVTGKFLYSLMCVLFYEYDLCSYELKDYLG